MVSTWCSTNTNATAHTETLSERASWFWCVPEKRKGDHQMTEQNNPDVKNKGSKPDLDDSHDERRKNRKKRSRTAAPTR